MLSNHPIPAWIYEPMPYAYGLLGSMSTYKFDHSLGQLAGVLLIAAGLLVWFMRRQYRRGKQEEQHQRRHDNAPTDGIQLRYYRD